MAHKCAHKACYCDPEGKEYCSKHCTEAALFEEELTTCECGHIPCEEQTATTGGVHTTAR